MPSLEMSLSDSSAILESNKSIFECEDLSLHSDYKQQRPLSFDDMALRSPFTSEIVVKRSNRICLEAAYLNDERKGSERE